MAVWPGGPCPGCGDDMPPALVHCQSCRALLNQDLKTDSVVIPEFMPLEEISTMIEVEPRGHYVVCPKCSEELRINAKYVGKQVACKHCESQFVHNNPSSKLKAFYGKCPHCSEEIRASMKYLGMKVACKHCGGHIHCVAEKSEPAH